MDETIKLIAQTGTIGAVCVVSLYFLGRVIMKVAERMILAIDGVRTELRDHTANEQAHVGELQSDIAVIKDRLGIVSEEMPPLRKTPPIGVAIRRRPPTLDE